MQPEAHEISAGDDEIRRLAAEILTREEYADFRGDLAAWEAVFEFFRGFPEWAESLRIASPGLFWLMMLGLLATAGLLLLHTGWTLRAALSAPPPETATEIRRLATKSLLARAEELAHEGDFLEAARHVQLATLERLLDRGVIDLSRSETNRVLRERLHSAHLPPEQLEALLEALTRLEAALFREPKNDPALYESWLGLYSRLSASRSAVAA